MRRKNMMVAVFLSALTLGACVDNEESASVTEVRSAKAAQLKSVAAMNNAEAQAKLIFANAEAALKAAQADAEKANAEKTRADIEIAKKQAELIELQKEAAKLQNEAAVIENKRRQAELEGQLALLEVTKKNAEASLKQIADAMIQQEQNAKIALAKLQLELKKAEQELLDYDQKIADAKTEAEKNKLEAEKQESQTLSKNYSTAIESLITEQQKLSTLKNTLLSFNNGLITTEESKARAIAENKTQIALNNNRIDAYKKYANYTEDVDALNAQLKQIEIALLPLDDKRMVAQNKLNSLIVDWSAIYKKEEAAIYADDFYRFMNSSNGYYDKNENTWITTYPFNKYISYGNNGYNDLKLTATKYQYKVGKYEYTEFYGNSYSIEYKFIGDPRMLELDVNQELERVNYYLKSYNTSLEKAQKDYNGKPLDSEGIAIRNAIENTAFLKKAYDAEKDPAKKAQLLADYKVSLENEKALLSTISDYKGYIARENKEIARINKQYTMYKDAAKLTQALQVKIDARNKAVVAIHVAKVAAWKESIDAMNAYYAKYDEATAINALLNGTINGSTGASVIKDWITTLEKANATLEKENADVANILSQKENIAYQEARIKAQEVMVAAKEIAVKDAKAALDAAMKNVQ